MSNTLRNSPCQVLSYPAALRLQAKSIGYVLQRYARDELQIDSITFSGGEVMIVFKMVTKEKDGKLVSLMEAGSRQIEYAPGEFSYPPIGVLYARDSREAALEAVKTYISTSIPTAELWEAEATGVTPTFHDTIVECQSLKLLKKIYPMES